ncbi:hypothetical protein ACQJBY_053471 [Aegilops geniculata]
MGALGTWTPPHQPQLPRPVRRVQEHARVWPGFDERSVRFMSRLLERWGLESSRAEVELIVFSAIDNLLAKTKVAPEDIDILVVNCSLFAPTASFIGMIVNRYNLRKDVRNVHLAGLVFVGVARNLLQVAPRGLNVLVVSMLTITPNYYIGKECHAGSWPTASSA